MQYSPSRLTPVRCGCRFVLSSLTIIATCTAVTSLADDGHREALPGWEAIGPERGHVIDTAVGDGQVLVATRVGVMAAEFDREEVGTWRREPRFPVNTRRIEPGVDGTWWCSASNAVWHISDRGTTCVPLVDESYPVDIAVMNDGSAIVAVRGQSSGVIRAGADGTTPVTLLSEVDPWCVVARGEQVWVGTLGQGMWVSDDGGWSFSETRPGACITALEFVGQTLLMGLRDGSVVDVIESRTIGTVEPGWATGFAQVDEGVLLVLSASPNRPESLSLWDGASFSTFPPPRVDNDPTHLNITGLWPLNDTSVLVGTFRRGPLAYENGVFRPVRSGFRASNLRGAVRRGDGLMVAMMGTGVYLSDATGDNWRGQHRYPGPVTDTLALSSDGDAVIAVDFEGVTRLDATGGWTRFGGVHDPAAPTPNGLTDVRVDGEGRWWGLTKSRRLMLLVEGGWQECSDRGARRLDGNGEHLLLLTNQGFFTLDSCSARGKRVWPDVPMPQTLEDARADEGWLAVPGALYRSGALFAVLPQGRIGAIAGRDDEALVVVLGSVLSCRQGLCVEVGVPFGEPSTGVGWLEDGRAWYTEAGGTVWASGGRETPARWSSVVQPANLSVTPWSILRVPWSMEGVQERVPDPHPGGGANLHDPEHGGGCRGRTGIIALFGGLLTVVVGGALLLRSKNRGRR